MKIKQFQVINEEGNEIVVLAEDGNLYHCLLDGEEWVNGNQINAILININFERSI